LISFMASGAMVCFSDGIGFNRQKAFRKTNG
jgi:hypothetical protein